MKNSQKGSLIAWVVLVIVIIVILGVYYFNHASNSQVHSDAIQQSQSTSTEENLTATNRIDTKAGLTSYVNPDYGFSISLPSTWMQDSQNSTKDNVIFISPDLKKGESYKLIFRPGDAVTYPDNRGSVNIGNITWNITGSSDIEGYSVKYSTNIGGIKYDFIVHGHDEPFLKQLFTTFVLNNSTAGNTFTDSNFGFSFTYPKPLVISTDNAGKISLSMSGSAGSSTTLVKASSVADDSNGKWGKYIISYTNNSWAVQQESEEDGTLRSTQIVPSFYTASGLPVFNGGIRSHGWGMYDYVVALSHTKFLIISGPDNSINGPYNADTDPTLPIVKSVTLN